MRKSLNRKRKKKSNTVSPCLQRCIEFQLPPALGGHRHLVHLSIWMDRPGIVVLGLGEGHSRKKDFFNSFFLPLFMLSNKVAHLKHHIYSIAYKLNHLGFFLNKDTMKSSNRTDDIKQTIKAPPPSLSLPYDHSSEVTISRSHWVSCQKFLRMYEQKYDYLSLAKKMMVVIITWALHCCSSRLLFPNLQVGRPVFFFLTALTEMGIATVHCRLASVVMSPE